MDQSIVNDLMAELGAGPPVVHTPAGVVDIAKLVKAGALTMPEGLAKVIDLLIGQNKELAEFASGTHKQLTTALEILNRRDSESRPKLVAEAMTPDTLLAAATEYEAREVAVQQADLRLERVRQHAVDVLTGVSLGIGLRAAQEHALNPAVSSGVALGVAAYRTANSKWPVATLSAMAVATAGGYGVTHMVYEVLGHFRELKAEAARNRAALTDIQSDVGAFLALKTGPAGPPGRDGTNGTNGANGRDGKDGKHGRDGKDGAPGRHGKDGAPGRDGKDGRHGKDGAPGRDGVQVVKTIDRTEYIDRTQTVYQDDPSLRAAVEALGRDMDDLEHDVGTIGRASEKAVQVANEARAANAARSVNPAPAPMTRQKIESIAKNAAHAAISENATARMKAVTATIPQYAKPTFSPPNVKTTDIKKASGGA